jgi:pimeloyl-ACP methyl ester carboxylesterase
VTEDTLLRAAAEDARRLSGGMTRMHCIDGYDRRVFSSGSGPAVVCVPVLSSLNFLYAPQIAALSPFRRVVTYEPNVSLSRRLPLQGRVAELRSVLATLGIGSADILGWSDAGAVACAFARAHPEMTRSLTLLSLPRAFPTPLRLLARVSRAFPLEKLLPAAALAWPLGLLARGRRVSAGLIAQVAREIPEIVRVLKYSLLPILEDHRVEPGTINARAVVLNGSQDRIVSAREARALVAALPNAEPLVVVPDGEHFLTYANAAAVNATVARFLARA